MEWLLLVAGLVGAAAWWVRRRRRRHAEATMSPMIEALGLLREAPGSWLGKLQGHAVSVRAARDQPGVLAFSVAGLPTEIGFQRRSVDGGIPKSSWLTGDATLDRVAVVTGDPVTWLSLLTPDARTLVAAAAEHDLTLDDGKISGHAAALDVVRYLRHAVTTATALVPSGDDPRDVVVRLVAVDPDPGVRARAFEALQGCGKWVDEAAYAASGDPDARMRLRAANHRADVPALLSLVLDPSTPHDVQDRAWFQLRERHAEPLEAGLSSALEARPVSLLVLRRAASLGSASLTEPLLEAVSAFVEAEEALTPATADAVIDVLRQLPAERARGLLVALVARGSLATAAAAIGVLRRSWGPHLVQTLQEVAKVRPELHRIIDDFSGMASLDASAVRLSESVGFAYDPVSRMALAPAPGPSARLLFESTRVSLTIQDLPNAASMVPRPAQLSPLSDDPFHARHRVSHEADALAWYTSDVRARVMAFPSDQVVLVKDGRLRVIMPLAPALDLRSTYRMALALCEALETRAALDPEDRRRDAWQREMEPDLRRLAAREVFAGDAVLAHLALDDSDPSVALLAAAALRRADVLARIASDKTVPAKDRRNALRDLWNLDDRPAMSTAVGANLRDADLGAAAIGLVGRLTLFEHAIEVGRMIDEIAPPGSHWTRVDDPRARAALRTLAVVPVPAVEQTLVHGLSSSDASLRLALIRALGEVGTGPAARALAPIAAGWSMKPEVAATRLALDRIRKRAGEGALSIAQNFTGQLSEAQGGGELEMVSVPVPPEQQAALDAELEAWIGVAEPPSAVPDAIDAWLAAEPSDQGE